MQTAEKIIDFHAHILPEFDDGPGSCREASEILVKLYDQGVTHVVSTSHFYRHEENISSFLERRSRSQRMLREYLDENNISHVPQIITGAEVYFSTALAEDPDLEKLCIENTDYMLIELPYSRLNENVLTAFRNLAYCGRVKPVLAHIERYAKYGDEKTLMSFLECAPGQINCDSQLSITSFRLCARLIKSGCISAIGTDVHNTATRPPRFAEARKKISRRFGAPVFSEIMDSSARILGLTDQQ